MIKKLRVFLVLMVLVLTVSSILYIFHGNMETQPRARVERTYTEHESIRINNNSQFDTMAQQEHWSGNGGYLSPYIIENYEIDGRGNTAFYIGNTTRYFLLRYSHIYNFSSIAGRYNYGVVEFYNVQNGEVYGCNITHGQYGVYITAYSSENSVEYNDFYNITTGVYLYFYTSHVSVTHNNLHYGVHVGTAVDIAYYSDNNDVWYNSIDGPATGVYINGQSGECTGNIVSRNAITTTREYGVYVYSSSSNRVENNTIRNSMDEGIRVYLSSNVYIVNNSVIGSINYGVDLHDCDNTLVYNNSLVSNNGATDTYAPSHVQAVNNGSGNQWYYKNHGNYWSDWTVPDNDTNGIVDSPYTLDGDSGSNDPYPLAESSHPIPELNFFFSWIILVLGMLYFVRKR